MSEKLNFGNAGDDLRAFDSAPGPDSFDLSGFDAATGATTVPPGKYVLRIEEGKLTKTNAGKQAYRLRFVVVEPAAHAGFTLWKTLVLEATENMTYKQAMNRAKNALAPFELTTVAHLRDSFPPFGSEVYCEAVVTLRAATAQYGPSNDVERFTPCPPPASSKPTGSNPFAVPLDDEEKERGKQS